MKRGHILLGLLLSLCLMISLTGGAVTADKAENLVKFMDTGGWPPELLGSWIGNMWESCSQFTFNYDGSYSEMVFESRSRERTGTVFTLPETWKTTFEGDILHLSMYAGTGDFHRIEVPYVRLTAWDETAAASVDPEILGTFGGRWKGRYIERTFHGDGSFTQVTPYDELEESGYYTAGGGVLAIHLDDEIILCKYYKSPHSLRLWLPNNEVQYFLEKYGPLKQMNVLYDFGWRYPQGQEALESIVIMRYFGIQAEVGIPTNFDWAWGYGINQKASIGDEAFKHSNSLKSVTLLTQVDRIGKAAFEDCNNLTSVMLIDEAAGIHLYNPSIEIAATGTCHLKTIGDNAFRGCISLKDMNVADTISQSLYSDSCWIGHSDLTGVNIPNGVTAIGAHAFDGCAGIESMTIPDSVTQIGEGAFNNCPALKLKASEGSYAHQYAQDNGLRFEVIGK